MLIVKEYLACQVIYVPKKNGIAFNFRKADLMIKQNFSINCLDFNIF